MEDVDSVDVLGGRPAWLELRHLDKSFQLSNASRVTHLAKSLRFDLANTLAGDVELFANLLKGVVGVHVDTKAHA